MIATTRQENKATNIILRGQVWMADLGTTKGSEQGGIRPVLVIQNNIGNKYSPTFTICPLTSKKMNKKLPTHVLFKNQMFLPEISVALVEQTRTIDGGRFINMLGVTNDNVMIEVDTAIKIQMGLKDQFSYDEAYEMLNNINNIKSIIDEVGRNPRLLQVYGHEVAKFKKYCDKYSMNYKLILVDFNKERAENSNIRQIINK